MNDHAHEPNQLDAETEASVAPAEAVPAADATEADAELDPLDAIRLNVGCGHYPAGYVVTPFQVEQHNQKRRTNYSVAKWLAGGFATKL